MKNKPIVYIALIVVLVAAAWLLVQNTSLIGNGTEYEEEGMMRTWNLHVQKRGGDTVWRVWDAGGNNRGRLEVRPGDRINWRAHGSDMDFRFKRDVNPYFEFAGGLFQDDTTQSVAQNDWLRVTLKENAPKDSLVYQVHIETADTVAVGNSPPVLIIY